MHYPVMAAGAHFYGVCGAAVAILVNAFFDQAFNFTLHGFTSFQVIYSGDRSKLFKAMIQTLGDDPPSS
jgi:hypothetical protein